MPIVHNYRILIETHKGKKFSYIACDNNNSASISQSIFNSDTFPNYAMSSSQVWDRITASLSCSYQNDFTFSSSADQFKTSVSKTSNFLQFEDNIYLSSSLNGGDESGSIQFIYTGVEAGDRLNRFKFFGSGFCTSLNLVENFWYRSDEFKLTSGSESHYFKGDVDAESMTILGNFNVASVGSVTTHLPFRIDKTDSKLIKFVNVSGSNIPNNDVSFGYNQIDDQYVLSASFRAGETAKFNIGGVNKIQSDSFVAENIGIGTSSINPDPQLYIRGGSDATLATKDSGFIVLDQGTYNMILDENEIMARQGINTSNLLIQHEGGNVITNHGAGNFMIGDTGESGLDILSFTPPAKLTVAGDISASGTITANEYHVNVVSSSVVFSDGSTQFGDSSGDDHLFEGDISASGVIFADRFRIAGSNSGDFISASSVTDIQIGDLESESEGNRIKIGNLTTALIAGGDDTEVKVGIGTQTAPKTLTVQGDISASGNFYSQGNIESVTHITASGNISGSSTSDITVGGNLYAKTYKSEKINSFFNGAVDNTWYYFPIGPNPYSSIQAPGSVNPLSGFQATAMCDLSITRLKLTFFFAVTNMGTLSMKLQKYDGSGNPDATGNWGDVGTTWEVTDADLADGARAYHAPTDWDISAGENYILAFNSNTSGGQTNVIWMNGGITVEEDWNTQIAS